MIDVLSFLQCYNAAIAIILALVGGSIIWFGKLVQAENPGHNPDDESHQFVVGFAILFRIFLTPFIVLLLLAVLTGLISLTPPYFGIIDQPTASFAITVISLAVVGYELKKYQKRTNHFKEHEEYNKQPIIWVFSYFFCALATVFWILHIQYQIQQEFSAFGWVLVAINFLLVLYIFLSTALVSGLTKPKPKVVITLLSNRKIEGFFIRWENDCLRVVPKGYGSMLIPRYQIKSIHYPYPKKRKG